MAREILFKAKRIDNGEWVEGYYQKRYDEIGRERHYIFWCESHLVWEYAEIDINTLCQYTEVTDKNGNKIWENNIVQHDFGSGFGIGIQKAFIPYSKEYHGFLIRPINDWQYTHLQDCEVIGNVFDNPELLGGASDEMV